MKRMGNEVKAVIRKKLMTISEQLIPEDKKAAKEQFKLTDAAISNYLNGLVPNVERGLSLLEFFHAKVNERKERVKAIKVDA